MNKDDIKELHFITYIENVPSIMANGILPRNKARNLTLRDISAEGVQERRKNKKIPGTTKSLHDYANLYFDTHNPMLSVRRTENNEICILRIQSSVLDIPGVIVTDKNAARECWFKTVSEGLPLLNKNEIYATFWTDVDPIKAYKHAGIKCAEVLVPDCVGPNYIFGAYVANNLALDKLRAVSQINGIIKSAIFF
ncbi:MAG: DUF4433 domain-containing protein [Candidatus Omnitrophota bacterium]|nr:DUF4433 domain-containing protein [Candidatus Omnitrophota bacterium]